MQGVMFGRLSIVRVVVGRRTRDGVLPDDVFVLLVRVLGREDADDDAGEDQQTHADADDQAHLLVVDQREFGGVGLRANSHAFAAPRAQVDHGGFRDQELGVVRAGKGVPIGRAVGQVDDVVIYKCSQH